MLKRELIKLLEEDAEFRDIARAKLGVAELTQTLQGLVQALEGLIAEIREQNSAVKTLAETCRNSSSDIAALKDLAEREIEALKELARIVEKFADTLGRGQSASTEALSSKLNEVVEAVRRLDETIRRLIATL